MKNFYMLIINKITTKPSKFMLLLVVIFTISLSVNAQNTKVVVIGKQTPLQKQLIGDRKSEIKEINRTPKKSDNEKPQSEKLLDGVEEVHVNAANFTRGTMSEDKYLKEAMKRNIPMVIENVKKDDLVKLAGIGVDAKVAIVESRSDVRGVRVAIIESEKDQNSGLKMEPDKGEDVMEEMVFLSADTTGLTPSQIKELKLEESKLKSKKPVKVDTRPVVVPSENLPKKIKRTLEYNKKKRKILPQKGNKISPQKGKKTGSVNTDFENYYVSTNSNFMDSPNNSEVSVIDVPKYSEYYIEFTMPQRKWDYGEQTEMRVNVRYEVILYATTSPQNKWLKIKSIGEVDPGNMIANSHSERGYYTESFYQSFKPANPSSEGELYKSSPTNANEQTTVSHTTGWSVSVGAGLDKDGPSINVSATESESTTHSFLLKDFDVNNSSDNKEAKFNYKLSKCGDGARYNTPRDLMYVNGGYADVRKLPNWATGNLEPKCEAVWKFPKTHNQTELLYFGQQYFFKRVDYTHTTSNTSWFTTYYYHHFSRYSGFKRWDEFPTVDFSLVQIPHFGIDAEDVSQSSTDWNGYAGRAVDGVVDGTYHKNSVTHTNHDMNAWWEIELKEKVNIGKLEIWNRTDACCTDRLKDYYVFASKEPFSSKNLNETIEQVNNSSGNMFKYYVDGVSPKIKSIEEIAGRWKYIRIQMKDRGTLSLAEVRIIPVGYY